MNWPKSETELAAACIDWLRSNRWTIYQEVQPHTWGRSADIVAVQGKVCWVIETKRTFGLDVINQAANWRGSAHYVSVCVPRRKDQAFAELVCRKYGIGVLSIKPTGYGQSASFDVHEHERPSLNRIPSAGTILAHCKVEHQDYAKAGNAEGRRWTPFQATCDEIRRLVTKSPGVTLKELLGEIKHHYRTPATARSCIAKWAEDGAIRGVRSERDGRAWRLFPDKVANCGYQTG